MLLWDLGRLQTRRIRDRDKVGEKETARWKERLKTEKKTEKVRVREKRYERSEIHRRDREREELERDVERGRVMGGVGCPLHLPAKEWPQLWETDEHVMPISHSNQYKSQSL